MAASTNSIAKTTQTLPVNDDQNPSPAYLRASPPSKPCQQWKQVPAPHHSNSGISRQSSFTSKSQSINKPHHAYFASSEEESEAELDEKDSHSDTYVHPMVSILAGSKSRLAQIANKVSHHSPPTLTSSRVRIREINRHNDPTITHLPHPRKDSSGINGDKPIASIYKATGRGMAVPPPPQTVTVAVGKNGIGADPPPNSHHPLQPPSKPRRRASTDDNPNSNLPTFAASLSRRKRRCKKNRQEQNHLPCGLPVFKDPRSCMWTTTYDANAPSEDRYSSLVNVLLRPPKTPREKKTKKQKTNENNSAGIDASNDEVVAATGVGSDFLSDGIDNRSSDKRDPVVNNRKQAAVTMAGVGSLHQEDEKEAEDDKDTSLIRLSLWSVIDGHGGGCVATYAAEVLLPHIAASVARALKSEIVDRGVCNVNGQLRDANALDLDGLIRSSDRSRQIGKSQVRQREAGIDVVNPNSIHYRSPYEDSESEDGEGDGVEDDHMSNGTLHHHRGSRHSDVGSLRSESESEAESEAGHASSASHLLPRRNITAAMESVTSSVKTSVKTARSPAMQHAPVGTHSPAEVAAITRAITDSFLAVDEGWINSIDPVTTHQTSCVSNGRWNAGACALVVFTIQRLDWCSSRADDDIHEETHDGDYHHVHRESGAFSFDDTSHNKDAARRRKLDYAGKKCKSVSSLSTLSVLSSTSSITTEANTTDILVEESEITETEDDVSDILPRARCRRKKTSLRHHDDMHRLDGHGTSACYEGHYYHPHDAMMYTAHVGDCRAVMLGSAPPRTIKVMDDTDKMCLSLDHSDRSEDESENSSNNESVADEISSIEGHIDSDSSDGEDMFLGRSDARRSSRGRTPPGSAPGSNTMLGYVRRGSSKRQRRITTLPFVPLPRLYTSEESDQGCFESDDSASTTAQDEDQHRHLPPVSIRTTAHTDEGRWAEEDDEIKEIRSVRSGSPTQMDRPPSPTQLVADPVHPPPPPLSLLMRPIDLTTDHSAYNPNEVTAVLRRCKNAPKAISSASSGGIKRVAGSLAVTRALGDAYLKTPNLSFFPYKRHAPYITGRPEVNYRVLTKGADRILTLASDGVWERASGDDVLRWVRKYYNSQIAGAQEQHLHAHPGNISVDKKTGDSDVATASANETTAPSHFVAKGAGVKRSHSEAEKTSASVSDVIVRKVLNKVRKARNISSLRMLMSLPKGRSRRSKHDDITASVVDLSGFIS